jgi:hypothetical protein
MSAAFNPSDTFAVSDLSGALQGDVPAASGQMTGFAAGTRIATPMGYVAVERLRAGDRVLCPQGRHVSILGVRTTQFETVDADTAPVRFNTGTYGNMGPLRLARGHSLRIESRRAERSCGSAALLAPAQCFVDGVEVIVETGDAPVTYVDLLFEGNEIVLAENVACEAMTLHQAVAAGVDGFFDTEGHAALVA